MVELLNIKRCNKVICLFIIIFFSMIMITVSLCTSFINIKNDFVNKCNRGSIKKQSILQISDKNNKPLNIDQIISICDSFTKENSLYIRGFSYTKMDFTKNRNYIVPVELVSLTRDSVWNPKIKSGSYFNSSQSSSNDNIAVVGDSIIKNKISYGNTVNIYDKEFNILGVIEDNNINLDYSGSIFIPMHSIPKEMKNDIKIIQIRLYNNNGNLQQQVNELKNKISSNSDLYIEKFTIDNINILCKTVFISIVIIIIIIILAIINIYFFYEYLIKNICTHIDMKKFQLKLFCLNFRLFIISSIITLAIQYIITPIIKLNFISIKNISELSISMVNIIVLIIFSTILSLIFSKLFIYMYIRKVELNEKDN